jgi:CDP-diacylglycerol---glycerol-3-phosphate 3-phosphatidyltransferase
MATVSPSQPPVLNLPNQLTAARLVLSLVLFALIAFESWIWCIVVFLLAAFTDWLDGYFARRHGLSSTLGRNLDPLVDKVMICGAYTFLLPYGLKDGWLLPWMTTVIVARELIITSLRSFLEQSGANFGADWLGKLKMGLQCAALLAVFVFLKANRQHESDGQVSEGFVWFFATVRDGCIWAMLAATALSGAQYLWRAASLLKTDAG